MFENVMNRIIQTVRETIEESNAFRAQEKACAKPVATPTPSSPPSANPLDVISALERSQKECACLASHIVKAMVNFPTHINIQPYTSAVAVIISKHGDNAFSVKFNKKDPSEEFTISKFRVELQPELNRRVAFVQARAVQAIEESDFAYSIAQQQLLVKYSSPESPLYGYDYGYYNELQSARLDYEGALADNRQFLNTIHFYGLVDCGNCVTVSLTASFNGGPMMY